MAAVDLLRIGEVLPNGTFRLFDGAREWRRIRQTAVQKNFLATKGFQHVQSSVISAVGVDGNNLVVRFHNGSIYEYRNAGDRYEKMLQSNSKGIYFNRHIRSKYQFNKTGNLPFPPQFKTSETVEMELLSDENIFDTLQTQDFKELTRNLVDPEIKFNVAFDKNGNELLQILINGVAIYHLMSAVLLAAQQPREVYLNNLGIMT